MLTGMQNTMNQTTSLLNYHMHATEMIYLNIRKGIFTVLS